MRLATPAGRDLSVYVPKWVRNTLWEKPDLLDLPFAERRQAALLFLDIADFSAITAKLAALGGRGAEELSNLLNDCFDKLTDVLEEHGADIVAFAGDSILATWEGEDAADVVRRASHCALALQDTLAAWARDQHSTMRQRIAIDVGDIFCCKLGGLDGRWHCLIVGSPLERIGRAYWSAKAGDVMLCEAAFQAIADGCEGEWTESAFRLARLTCRPRQTGPLPVNDPTQEHLERLIPKTLFDRMAVGGGAWGEFRSLTILQIALQIDLLAPAPLADLQRSFLSIQTVAKRMQGVIHQALMDDKGLSVAIAFGLPSIAREQDALRAVETALDLRREFAASGMRTSMGIASGRLFCGDYGGQGRRAFGLLGPASNLAASLMASAAGEVVCDAATAQAVNRRVSFTVLPQLRLKSQADPVTGFCPVALIDQPRPGGATQIVGREPERAKLREYLDRQTRGQGALVLVRGEPGIGKSGLLSDFVTTAEADGHRVLQGFASAIDRSTPYYAWRNVLRQALDLGPQNDPTLVRIRISERLSGQSDLLSRLTLLNSIILLDQANTALTDQIAGAAHAANIEALVCGILESAPRKPAVLVLEDLHWLDSASAGLLGAVMRRFPGLLVVASKRTGEPDAAGPGEFELSPCVEIDLDSVSPEALTQLIRHRLNAREIPRPLTDFVYRRSNGNPLFAEEIIFALQDAGILTVTRGVCHLPEQRLEVMELALSTTLEGAIVSRVDLLPPRQQMVLKVASAVGDTFSADVVQTVYSEQLGFDEIVADLRQLVEHQFLRVGQYGTDEVYTFRHAITQEVTYNLLSFAQRRALHRDIAVHIEQSCADRVEQYCAQLARHWRRADEPASAMRYLELAGNNALRSCANADATRYMSEVIELAEQCNVAVDDSRRAGWAAILGDAYHELADYQQAAAHYERAITLLGHQLSGRPGRRLQALLSNATRQIVLRVRRPHPQSLGADVRGKLQLLAHIYERLSEEYFFLNDSFAVLNGTLTSLNLAERSGAESETIGGFSALALGLGMSGMTAISRFYARKAHALAERHAGLPEKARVQLVVGVLCYGLGEWQSARQYADGAKAIYSDLGDRTRLQNSETMAIFVAILQGDFDQAERLLGNLTATISTDSSNQVKAWTLSTKVLIAMTRGSVDLGDLHELRALANEKLVRADQLLCLGVSAAGYLRLENSQNAREAAEQGFEVLKDCQVVWGGYVYGPAGVAEVLFREWERAAAACLPDLGARLRARTASKLLSRMARTSPVCRPRALLLKGRVAFLDGRHASASRHWRKAVDAADKLGMRHEQAVALYEVGRAMPRGATERLTCLEQAAEIFEKLGATTELAQSRLALSG